MCSSALLDPHIQVLCVTWFLLLVGSVSWSCKIAPFILAFLVPLWNRGRVQTSMALRSRTKLSLQTGRTAAASWVTQRRLIGVVVLSRIDWILGGAGSCGAAASFH